MFRLQKPIRTAGFIFMFLALVSLACNALAPATPQAAAPGGGLPDLVVASGTAGMALSGECLPAYGPITSRVCVQNQGQAPAGAFVLQAGETNWNISVLAPGESQCFDSASDLSGALVFVDPAQSVVEADEGNNTLTIPVPTPPLLCTPEEAATAALTPEPTAAPPTLEPTAAPDIAYEGVSFSYNPSLASSINAQVVPADSSPGVEVWSTPETIQFDLVGYPLTGTFHDPRIMIYPVDEYQALNPNAGLIISELQQLLAVQPPNPENIPFLPVFNAGQFMQAQVAYLETRNGLGVRFLTQYGQAAWPINNEDMFYAFQGLTEDGRYTMSAILPVSHPSLPAPESVTMDNAFYDQFPAYVDGVEAQLNGQPAESFNPRLDLLDEMIESLRIDR